VSFSLYSVPKARIILCNINWVTAFLVYNPQMPSPLRTKILSKSNSKSLVWCKANGI
jgi:hypothetical protein